MIKSRNGAALKVAPYQVKTIKEIPCDVEIEKKLLSALMLKGGVAVSQAVEVLREDDFYRSEHRLIYCC